MRILKSFDLNRDYSVFPNCKDEGGGEGRWGGGGGGSNSVF